MVQLWSAPATPIPDAEPMQKPRSAQRNYESFHRPGAFKRFKQPEPLRSSVNRKLFTERSCSPDGVLEFAQPIEDVGVRPIRQRARGRDPRGGSDIGLDG